MNWLLPVVCKFVSIPFSRDRLGSVLVVCWVGKATCSAFRGCIARCRQLQRRIRRFQSRRSGRSQMSFFGSSWILNTSFRPRLIVMPARVHPEARYLVPVNRGTSTNLSTAWGANPECAFQSVASCRRIQARMWESKFRVDRAQGRMRKRIIDHKMKAALASGM